MDVVGLRSTHQTGILCRKVSLSIGEFFVEHAELVHYTVTNVTLKRTTKLKYGAK